MGDGSSQLDVLRTVSSGITCTRKQIISTEYEYKISQQYLLGSHWRQWTNDPLDVKLIFTGLKSFSLLRTEVRLWCKSTQTETWSETHFRESFQNFRPSFSLCVTDLIGWMDGFHYFPIHPLPHPLYTIPFLSAWKEAWCPLKSPSQAKEMHLSPGNLGPSELLLPLKTNFAWIGSFRMGWKNEKVYYVMLINCSTYYGDCPKRLLPYILHDDSPKNLYLLIVFSPLWWSSSRGKQSCSQINTIKQRQLL